MTENPESAESKVIRKHSDLSDVINGLKKAIALFDFSEEEKELFQSIIQKSENEKKELKKEFPSRNSSKEEKKRKISAPKPTTIAYKNIKKKLEDDINVTNKKSGLNKQRASMLQGGAPGCGKKR